MGNIKNIISAILFLILLPIWFAGCDNDEKKDTFSGYGKLVTERQEARERIAGKRRGGKKEAAQESDRVSRQRPSSVKPAGKEERVKRSPEMEKKWQYRTPETKSGHYTSIEKVIVLSSDRKRVLGRGQVYIDEKGKIIGVRIR